MTRISARCRRCGAPLGVSGEPCPACLLGAALKFETGTSANVPKDVLVDTQPTPDPAPSPPGAHPDTIGPYRILGILGEGGMGIVYLAQQREPLRRNVAIKVIKLGLDTQGVVARFDAERQTLALMDHPNIASVFYAGTTGDGRPYFAMEYVAGVPITEYCDTARLSTRERLTLLTHVCSAIQHAHQKGVIHRDIKPSNVLVAVQDGQPTPKVIDFGIAKATEHSVVERTLFTQHGQLVGTPEYMSPEQADRSRHDIDATTDIYSLGVVLYELLVGVLPFDPVLLREAGYNEMLRIVCEDEPPRPSARLSTLGATASEVVSRRHTEIETLRRELRGDLDWIILRAMEKDRARRYASASELSADIVRYLRLEPVLARPPSVGYRTTKFVRRHRLAVAAASLLAVVTLSGLVVSTSMYVRADRSRREAEYQAYAANISSANFAFSTLASCPIRSDQCAGVTSLRSVRDRLDALPERLRHWEWGFFAFAADPALDTVRIDVNVEELVRTVDGRRLLLKDSDNRRIFAIDAVNPTRAASIYQAPEEVNKAPGQVLAVGQGGTALVLEASAFGAPGAPFEPPRTLQFVDVASGRVLQSLPNDSKTWPGCASISADNRRAVVYVKGGQFTVWDMVAGARIVSSRPGAITFTTEPSGGPDVKEFCRVGLSPDGSLVLSSRGGLVAWSSSTGAPVATDPASLPVSKGPGKVNDRQFPPIAFSPDGRRAAIGRLDGEVAVLDLTSRPITVQFLPARGVEVQALAFSTNGARLVVSTSSGGDHFTNRVSLWALERPPHRLSEFNHDSMVNGLAFSADDATILGHCEDGEVHTWAATSMAAMTTLADAHTAPTELADLQGFNPVQVSPSGRLVASISTVERGTVALWRVSDATQIATWATRPLDSADQVQNEGDGIASLSFSSDERLLALGYGNGRVEIRRVPSGALVRDFAAHTKGVSSMATSMDGRWLATGSEGTVRVWDWVTGVEQGKVDLRDDENVAITLAFRSDAVLVIGTFTLFGGPDGAYLGDWRSKRILAFVDVVTSVYDIAISPKDGRIALALSGNGGVPAISIWDSGLTHEVARLVGTGVQRDEATSVAYSPDGQRLVSAGEGMTRIWNAERFDLLAALDLGLGAFRVRFTPDGRRLVAAGTSITILDSQAPARPPVRPLALDDRRSR